ncbi:hypothetical protein JXB27_03405 [Candidatus Woesearchaeota archaeon]|nr:hypothetical protein [Candidatus Woesearchaeota archaeon]
MNLEKIIVCAKTTGKFLVEGTKGLYHGLISPVMCPTSVTSLIDVHYLKDKNIADFAKEYAIYGGMLAQIMALHGFASIKPEEPANMPLIFAFIATNSLSLAWEDYKLNRQKSTDAFIPPTDTFIPEPIVQN